MFNKSFMGACIAATALSINLKHVDQSPAALTEILAETKGEIDSAICLRTANRNKAALPNFNDILNGSTKYSDPDFVADWTSILWEDAGETFSEFSEA